jgi:hypothetical protein
LGKKKRSNHLTISGTGLKKMKRIFPSRLNPGKTSKKIFFSQLSPMLNQLREEIYSVTGMFDEDTVELILTAEGAVKNIPFVEELVGAAPRIDG